jgi:hypothetical protein
VPRPVRATALALALLAGIAGLVGRPGGPAQAVDEPAGQPVVVVIGVSGLRWDDVQTLSTPALWEVSRRASIGTLAARSVRSSACPVDGWLALSAGARAADVPGAAYGECRTVRDPLPDGSVRAWAEFVESAAAGPYDPRLGLLGEAARDGGVAATAIGPGAAIALADSAGVVAGTYLPRPLGARPLSQAVSEALAGSRLVVVDAGVVRDTGRAMVDRPDAGEAAPEPAPTGEEPAGPDVITQPTRPQQVAPVDARIGAVLAAVDRDPRDITVLLVSMADSGTRARMQLAAALGPAPSEAGGFGGSLLGSRSTRQPGMLQATDVTPTVLAALGLADLAPAGALVGSLVRPVPGASDANHRLQAVLDIDRHSAAVRPITPRFYTLLIATNLLLYALVALGLSGRFMRATGRALARWAPPALRSRAANLTSRPRVVLRLLRRAGVVVGALPIAGFLANLSPWWRAGSPGWALIGLVVGWMAVIGTLALVPRWRHPLIGPMAVVAGVTALVIAVDVLTGARVQVSAPMGVQPVVAGRFYGFNNTAFALFAAATILVAVAVADPLVRAGRRRLAAGLVAGTGLVVTVLDGMPGLGSDFGGPPALVPGFTVLALLAAGIAVSWGRLVLIVGGGAVVVSLFAFLDWLRPAEDRTHLGRFVDTVLDGGLGRVVARKLSQNVDNLGGSWLTLLALGGIALVVLVLARPRRWTRRTADGESFSWLSSGAPLAGLGREAPMLRPGVTALAVTLGIGFAVNDSGIVIPALGISVAVPLLVAVCAGWLLGAREAAEPARAAGLSGAAVRSAG